MRTIVRAEHVGSLLRPPYLLAARTEHESGSTPLEGLRCVEDRAIEELLTTQRDAGIGVFTDGEARRESWRAGLLESLNGVVPMRRTMHWYRDGRELSEEETLHDGVVAVARVSRSRNLTGVEAGFMRARANGPFKITMISASMAGMIWDPERSAAAYPDIADLVADLTRLQIDEINCLVENYDVRWVQLDSLSYTQAIDAEHSGGSRSRVSPEQALDAAVSTDSEVIKAVRARHPEVTFGLHICRGNYRSSWMSSGSYEPVAERLLNEVPADRFLLEYDSERAGGFEPLRFLPSPGPVVVLGLVTTKVPALEDQRDLLHRIDEAARYAPLDQLAISPQCGFASGSLGNLITADDQRRKLELVTDTARKVWG